MFSFFCIYSYRHSFFKAAKSNIWLACLLPRSKKKRFVSQVAGSVHSKPLGLLTEFGFIIHFILSELVCCCFFNLFLEGWCIPLHLCLHCRKQRSCKPLIALCLLPQQTSVLCQLCELLSHEAAQTDEWTPSKYLLSVMNRKPGIIAVWMDP